MMCERRRNPGGTAGTEEHEAGTEEDETGTKGDWAKEAQSGENGRLGLEAIPKMVGG